MAVRTALAQFADSVGVGILGLNRTCCGASTSGLSHSSGVGLRWLRSLVADGGTDAFNLPSADGIAPYVERLSLPLWLKRSGDLDGSQLWAISVRGYKSNKRSLKPLNTAASWQAVQPLVVEERQRQQLLQPSGDGTAAKRRWRPPLGPIVDTCLPPVPEVTVPAEYTRIGVITGQYSLKPERVFGVVQLAGTQFKVATDDIIFVNQLPGVEVNDVLALDRVLLLGSRSQTIVGRPHVPGASVIAAVEEHFRDGKVHVFKKKKRKRYTKYQGPRPNLTTLRILQVRGIDPAPGDELALAPEIPVEVWDPRYRGVLGLLPEPEEQEQQAAQAGGQ